MENGSLTTAMPHELENTTTRGLMKVDMNEWDEEIIYDLFNERDANLIMKIHLPMQNVQDSWLWMMDDKGLFTVQSCYRMLQGDNSNTRSEFWKNLWSIQLPSKIVSFLWRVCRLCLPTATALASKHVHISAKCPWCRIYNEDAVHVLFPCSFARSV